MLLPISATAKTTLWIVLFGMAKATQYFGLAIVGIEGWQRIKSYIRRRKLEA
jgi:phosphoglycolate phosphatase